MTTTLATIPATVTQASSEDITWGNDVSAQLVDGQTVTLPVVTITDLSVRGQPQLGFTYGPSVTGTVISQRIPEGMLTALHNYRLVWGFTPSGTTDIRESATGVICPFGPVGSCPPAPRVGFLESANNLSDLSDIVTAVANLGLGGVVSGVATNAAAIAAETARAEGAEFTLTTGLASEITRATGAESALRTTVSGLAGTAWVANIAYPAETFVTNGAVLYQAPSGGVPSRVTFTPSDWTELATIALPVGTTSGTVAAGNDSRFAGSPAGTAGASLSATDTTTTNTRTPSTGSVTSATIASGGIALPSASTATTQSPLDNSTKLATTAYTDAATLVEKNRATTAEASLLPGPLPGQVVSTSITLTVNTHAYCNATSGPLSEALPTGQPLRSVIVVEKSDSSVNTVTATGNIRGVGSSSLVLRLQNESTVFEADSSGSWWPIAGHKTLTSLDARYQSAGTSVQNPNAPYTVTANRQMAALDSIVLADTTAGSFTVTLPVSPSPGGLYAVMKSDATAHTATVAPGAGVLNGNGVLGQQNQIAVFVFDGTNWENISSAASASPLGGGGLIPALRSSDILPVAATTATTVWANGRSDASAVVLTTPATIIGLAQEVSVGGSAGALLRFLLYGSDANGYPTGLLLDCGTAPVDTTAVPAAAIVRSPVVSLAVPAGLYYLLAVPQGAPVTNPTLRYINTVPSNSVYQGHGMAVGGPTTTAQCFQVAARILGAGPANPTWSSFNNPALTALSIA